MSAQENKYELLAAYLTENPERAKALLALSPEEATAKINSDGLDFTETEVCEFGQKLKNTFQCMSENGEMDEAALSEVAGGGIGLLTAAACVAAVKLGYEIGKDIATNHGW